MNGKWSEATSGVWAGRLGGVASDPREGDGWCHCSVCSRPTTMTGTKLCDRCWERRRNALPDVIEIRLFTLEEREPESLERVLCWIEDEPDAVIGEWHAEAFHPWWPVRGFYEPEHDDGVTRRLLNVSRWAPLPARERT